MLNWRYIVLYFWQILILFRLTRRLKIEMHFKHCQLNCYPNTMGWFTCSVFFIYYYLEFYRRQTRARSFLPVYCTPSRYGLSSTRYWVWNKYWLYAYRLAHGDSITRNVNIYENIWMQWKQSPCYQIGVSLATLAKNHIGLICHIDYTSVTIRQGVLQQWLCRAKI